MVSAALRKAGIRSLTIHSLRRSALTAIAENGMPMAALQRIAGHSSIKVTARYYLRVQADGHQGALQSLAEMDEKSAPWGTSGGDEIS